MRGEHTGYLFSWLAIPAQVKVLNQLQILPSCSQTLNLLPVSQNSRVNETQKIYTGKSSLIANEDKNLYLTFQLCDLL